MTADSSYSFVVVHIIMVSMMFRIENISGCEDKNDLKTVNMTTAVGSSVELPCNVTNVMVSIWYRGTQSLTLGTAVYEQWQQKYSIQSRNETTSSSSYFVLSLMIHNVTEDVSGLYTCQEEGCTNVKLYISVEVPPVLWLEANHSNISNSINVIQNKETIIRCKAIGGKPSVSLAWEINGVDETDGVTSGVVADGVSSILKYRANQGDRNMTCKTSGQIAISSLRSSVNVNVQYPPTCHILVHNESSSIYTVTCVCVASPEVSSSVILVNNFPYDESNTVSLPVTLPAKIYCQAENEIGVYKTRVYKHTPPITSTVVTTTQPNETLKQSPSGAVIVVIVLVIAIVIIAALVIGFLVYKNQPLTSTYSAWDNNLGVRTLSSRPPCPSPVVNHRITSVVDENYAYVPSHQPIVTNGLSDEKPKVTLDAVVGEGDEYNLQYFQIPTCTTENAENEYAAADAKEDDEQKDGCDLRSGSSCGSSFSDDQYFRSSNNWDGTQTLEGAKQKNMDPYEWTEPDKVEPYEWAKPNKGKQNQTKPEEDLLY